MEKQVLFYCQSCMDEDESKAGLPDFEFKQTTFDSLTDAVEHIMNNLDHYIYAEVEDESKLEQD